jgi:hypothetical protein
MHKGSEYASHISLYSDKNPKGQDAEYYLINGSNRYHTVRRVLQVIDMLEISAARDAMIKILFEWISFTEYDRNQADIYGRMSSKGMAERKIKNVKAEWRYYNNYIDLVLALFGEYLAKPALQQEELIADEVLKSEKVRILVTSVTKSINEFAFETFGSVERLDEILAKGPYAPLREAKTWTVWRNSYKEISTAAKIPFLYDITTAFKKVLDWEELPMANGMITKDNMRINVSTPREEFFWTSRARFANVPIWAAPSYTTHLLLTVARLAQVDRTTQESIRELQAYAYAIFAYWCRHYPHTATPIHRMYGVMTAAQEFDVPRLACEPSTMYAQALGFIQG